jgi:hypothetical protein
MPPRRISIALGLLLITILACGQPSSSTPMPCDLRLPPYIAPVSRRPFAMGFNRWPSDLTQEAVEEMYAFIAQHGDLILHHLDNGVPWPEALQGAPFSQHLREDWASSRAAAPPGHLVFVAITPLNTDRDGLARYHGEQDNMPLPKPWDGLPLNHPDVKKAYLNYASRVVEYYQPDYLAIGIEVNMLAMKMPDSWDAYLELHRETYQALKARYPHLPIFATFTYHHMRGDQEEADPAAQRAAVSALMPYSDLLGLSVYPYSWVFSETRRLPEDYFDLALQFDKPIAITETGMPSQPFSAFLIRYDFQAQDQRAYLEFLLRAAAELDFEFVVNWAPIDFEPMLKHFPPGLRDLGRYWAYTGLQRSDGCPKPALAIWDAYLALPRE